MTTKRTDTERLDFLETCEGWALVSDDAGHWALVSEGFQNLPDDVPGDIRSVFFIKKDQWKTTIREAIDVIMEETGE